MRFLLIAAWVGISTAAVHAEESPPADDWKTPAIEQVEACRQIGTIDHGPSEDCIGLIVAACPGKNGSTSSMVECFEIERQYWASQIAAPLRTLRDYKARYDSDDEYAVAPRLDTYQQDWEVWLRNKCDFAGLRYGRGSIGRITRGLCEMRTTGERVLELELMVRQDVRQ